MSAVDGVWLNIKVDFSTKVRTLFIYIAQGFVTTLT